MSISEVGYGYWTIRPGSHSAFQFMGLRSGLYAGKSSSSTPISTNHFYMDLTLCSGALSCWNRKGPSSNCCHKIGSTELSRMSLCAVALRFPFTGTKGPSSLLTLVVRVAKEDRRFLHSMLFSIRRSRYVSLCGLPLHGWAVVAPRRFHFTITAVTVEDSRAEIWQADLLESWLSMTVPLFAFVFIRDAH